jgi:hypothetical protein
MIGDRESEYQSFFGAALTVNPLEIGLCQLPSISMGATSMHIPPSGMTPNQGVAGIVTLKKII